MKKSAFLLAFLFLSMFVNAQTDEAKIQAKLQKYPAFSDCTIQVTKDTLATNFYKVDITYAGKTLHGETLKKNNDYLVLLDANNSFLNDLIKTNPGNLKEVQIKQGFYIVANKKYTISKNELPKKYQINIPKSDDKKSNLINYSVDVVKGFNLIGELQSNYITSIINTSPNTKKLKKVVVNTSLQGDVLPMIFNGKTPNTQFLQQLKVTMNVYSYLVDTDFYTTEPLQAIFTLDTQNGFVAALQTTIHVKYLDFLGINKEDFLVKGTIRMHPELHVPEIQLTATKPFKKRNLIPHIPKIKMKNLGLKLAMNPSKDKNDTTKINYSFDFGFFGGVTWGKDRYDVTFPKDKKTKKYRVEFANLQLNKLFPDSKFPLLKDAFKDISLTNVFLRDTYFEAKLPYAGINIDLVGFKKNSSETEYNLAFNFPSLNIADLVSHEAGFSFPKINIPHNVVAFYIPEINLPSKSSSNAKRTYQIPNISTFSSVKLKSFFTDDKGKSTFPKKGFSLNYGLSFELFDLDLKNFFTDDFKDLHISLDGIKLTQLNITTKTISCSFPIGKTNVKLTAFKMLDLPKMNLIFEVPNFEFKNYISGISGTPLADIGRFKNFKMIAIPSANKTHMEHNKVSLQWQSLPDMIKFKFPEFSGGNNSSLDFSLGFNIYAPTPQFSGNVKTFLDKLHIGKIPVFKAKISPNLLFKNWLSWNRKSSSSNSSTPANHNPQVQDSPEFREDFFLSDIPLPEFSVANISFKEPTFSFDGLKFGFPITITNDGSLAKSDEKLVSLGAWAAMIKASVNIHLTNNKVLKFNNIKMVLDKQNKAISFTTKVVAAQKIYETPKDSLGNATGKKTLKEVVPTSVFSASQMDVKKIGFEAKYNYNSKNFYGFVTGEMDLKLTNSNKTIDLEARLHYNKKEQHFTPLFKLFTVDGISFADFKNVQLPNPLPKLNHLSVYDIEFAENYFFLGLSKESIANKKIDSVNYIIAFKAKGKAKYNFGAKSKDLITELLKDAPNTIQIDNFYNEKFTYIPKGNSIKDVEFKNFPPKIGQHFNPTHQEKLTLNEGADIQALYNGTFDFAGIEIDVKKIPVGFRFKNGENPNDNQKVRDGFLIAMKLPHFSIEGVNFEPDTLAIEKENGVWNTTLKTSVNFDYEGKNIKFKALATPYETDSIKGVKFSSTSNITFQLPSELDYVQYENVTLSADIERKHKVTTIDLSGDLKMGGKTYKTTAELLKKDNKFNDIVFKLTGDAIALKDIPEINNLPEVDNITIKNPEISLHHIAGEITYNQFTTKGVIFKDPNAVALILGFDDFKLSDISSSIPKGIAFKKSTLVLSSNDFTKTVSNLPVAVRTYFKNFYTDNDVIPFTKGLSIFTNFNPANLGGDTGKFFKEIGMNQDFVIAGGLGASLSGVNAFNLYVSPKKDIKTKGNFSFINNVKKPKFYISYASGTMGMGLQAETHIKIDKDLLDFVIKLGLNYSLTDAPGIKMDAQMNGKWKNPMGLNGLAIKDVALQIDGELTGDLDISFKGTLDVDKDSIFVSATIPATGNLSKFAFCGTATTLSNETFLTIGTKLINGASNGKLSFQKISDEIPLDIIAYKDVALAFVPPLLPEQNGVKCSAIISGITGGGMAFKGKGILGNDKLGGTWNLAEVDATVGLLSGISVKAAINDIDLKIISLKDTKLDMVAKLEDGKPKTHFRLNGKADFLGIDEDIALNFSPQRISFEVDFKIPDLLTTKAKVYTTNGMNFKPDNTLMVYADIKDFLHNDYLNQLGKVVSDELKKLDKGYDALKKDIDNAQAAVDVKFATVKQIRREIIAERQEITNQLDNAKKKADDLQSDINGYNNDANSQKHKSCRRSYRIRYWVPFSHHHKTIHYTDWGCKATAWSKYVYYKGLADGLEAAKYVADKLVESIEASINFVPIEADPRMAAPLLALEAEKGVLAFAKASLNASEKINDKLSDLAKEVKTPDVLKNLFYLKKASVSGSFNAFQIAKDTISVKIKSKVFEQDVDGGIAITLNGMKDLKSAIINSLHNISKHKITAVKKINSAHKLYASPAAETLTFDWEKATGRVSDITTINNKVYGIGTNNLVYEYDPLAKKTKWKQISLSNFRVWRIAGGSNSLYAVGIGYDNPHKDFLWKWNGGTNWEKIPGIENTMDAAVGNDGTIYVVKEDNTVYYSSASSSSYKQISMYRTVLGKKMQVGVKRVLIATVGLQWHQITTARARRIDVDSKGNIYHIGLSNRVWKSSNKGASWVLVGGNNNKKYASNVFVIDDEVFIQQKSDKTTWFFESKFFNNWVRTNGKSNAITKVGTVLYSSAVDGDYMWKAIMPVNFTGWKKTNLKMRDIGSNSSGDVWGITQDNKVLKYNSGQNKWDVKVHRNVKRISVAESGVPYVIDGESGQHNKVIYFKNGGWHEAYLNTNAYDVGGQGHHISGAATPQKPSNVWLYHKKQNSYTKAGTGTGRGFRITEDATGNIWIIGGDHALWKWDGISWSKHGGWIRDLAIAPNGSIWSVGRNYDLWYKVNENSGFIRANRKATAVAFSANKIFVIGTDGFLWYLKI